MAGTKVHLAKAALIAAWQADADLAGVQVTFEEPTKTGQLVTGERIHLGDTTGTETWASLGLASQGAGKRREEWTIAYMVTVEQKGNDPEAVENRAFAIFNATKAVMAADPRLGGTVRQFNGIDFRHNTYMQTSGWATDIGVVVSGLSE